MTAAFTNELKNLLRTSDAKLRKHWAERMVSEKIPLASLMSLLHGEKKTAQRFTWLIGDLLELDTNAVVDCVPMMFSLRDQMPFPGMRRSVAKCLWYTNVPSELEKEAIPQLIEWLDNNDFSIGCKHYSAKALFKLAMQNRIDTAQFSRVLQKQAKHNNEAHASRMKKMHRVLKKQDSIWD